MKRVKATASCAGVPAGKLSLLFAQNLIRARDAAGLTQAELARRASVTVETVARLERVIRGAASANDNPSLSTMAALAEAVGVPLADMLRGDVRKMRSAS